MNPVIHDALSLSSGTIGSLIHNTKYAVIDKVQSDFVDFCEKHEGDFGTWVQAWHAFEIETQPSKFEDCITVEDYLAVALVHTPDGEQYTFLPDNQQLSLGF